MHAGVWGVTASVPLAQSGTTYRCLPVFSGRRNVSDAGALPDDTVKTCARGSGRVEGQIAVTEALAIYDRVELIGPSGCARGEKVDAAGRFAADGLPPGLYVAARPGRGGWAEVRVTEGATASLDLRPVEIEHARREERRTTCGCAEPHLFYQREQSPFPERLYQPRPRFSPHP